MTSALNFLVAAKLSEIAELRQLAMTGALVNVTGRMIHALQRERGLTNLFLGSQGTRFAAQRLQQVAECEQVGAELRECFRQFEPAPLDGPTPAAGVRSWGTVGNGARLFSRMAYVLQGLDAAPALRECVAAQAWSARRATAAYVRLIAGLLAVAFEAADAAPDPRISRLLVARFNFMQGKEFAGQERAAGSILFASGRADAAEQQRLAHLIESQERCLQVFAGFSSPGLAAQWASSQDSATLAELERMRRILMSAPDGRALDAGLSQAWFDCCTRRIDEMKQMEDALAQELLATCEARIDAARAELAHYQALLASPQRAASPAQADAQAHAQAHAQALSFFDETPAPQAVSSAPALSPNLERSILDLVHEQDQRLQSMRDELDTVRASLNERKVIERAKGLLMAHRQLSEDEAHKTLRQMAMNQNRRLVEVAQALLSMADVLPQRARG